MEKDFNLILQTPSFSEANLLEERIKNNLKGYISDDISIDTNYTEISQFYDFDKEGENLVAHTKFNHSEKILICTKDYILDISLSSSLKDDERPAKLTIEVYHKTAEQAVAFYKQIIKNVKLHKPDISNKIVTKFWSYNPGMDTGKARVREIDAYSWEEIKDNYHEDTAEALEQIMLNNDAGNSGKLIAWNGEPGTGKTTAIRTLFRERQDVECNYIVDPPAFFGQSAQYMLDVIFTGNNGPAINIPGFSEGESIKPMILILEDCGELISSNAKVEAATSLSKFLNIVDGIIGQGINLKVILTTNEDIRDFHEAVTRDGRLHSMITFKSLEKDHAIEWLDKRGIEPPDDLEDKITLAKLFHIANNPEKTESKLKKKDKSKIGFG